MSETAYHEAGHAVIATMLGARVHYLTIEPDHRDHPVREAEVAIQWPKDLNTRRSHRNQLLVALAGPAAEMVYRGEPLHPAFVQEWSMDWAEAVEIAQEFERSLEKQNALLERIARELFELFRRDDLWQATAEVADLLEAHETLEGDEVVEVLRRWITV